MDQLSCQPFPEFILNVRWNYGNLQVVPYEWCCNGSVAERKGKQKSKTGDLHGNIGNDLVLQNLYYSSRHNRFWGEFPHHPKRQGHLSFPGQWPSACWSLQPCWNRETKYFSKLQEETFWHAWNLPENCIKIKSGELRVPHQHERSRHLYIFRVAGSTIKKLWVCGIKDGGGVGPPLWQRWLWERPDHLLSHALYVLADVHDGMQSSFVLFAILPITCCAHLKSY